MERYLPVEGERLGVKVGLSVGSIVGKGVGTKNKVLNYSSFSS